VDVCVHTGSDFVAWPSNLFGPVVYVCVCVCVCIQFIPCSLAKQFFLDLWCAIISDTQYYHVIRLVERSKAFVHKAVTLCVCVCVYVHIHA
jgi:hypothetical protein